MTEHASSILLVHDDLVLRLSLRQLSDPRDDLLEDVVVLDLFSDSALSGLEAAAVRDALSDPLVLEEIFDTLSGRNRRCATPVDDRTCCDLLFKVRRVQATLRALKFVIDELSGAAAEADGFLLLTRVVQVQQAAEILEAHLIGHMPATCRQRATLLPADRARKSPPGFWPFSW